MKSTLNCFASSAQLKKATAIKIILKQDFSAWLAAQNAVVKNWLTASGFKNEAGNCSLLPDAKGNVSEVICIVTSFNNFWNVGQLPVILPEGTYTFDLPSKHYSSFAMAWGLGAYQFSRYKKPARKPAQLVLLKDAQEITNTVEAIYLVRDLINTPTEQMGPSELALAAADLSKHYQAKIKHIIGDDLIKHNYPLIHAVGRACDDAPRLIDIKWGNKKHPKVTLVGKGVCFDTGGLDIKNAAGMLLMKKDMGGAAHVLGLARMIMAAKLPVQLRVLIPAVENSVSGNAFRPGDVITSRKGTTIEIGNTDAEGRLVLADALTEAVSDKPDLLIDMATLTGAARVALGTELPGFFCNDDQLAADLIKQAHQVEDPIWQLPLFALYREALNSPIADLNNCTSDGYGGAITAALFLKEFVPDSVPWVHFDLMAWNVKSRSGRPQGGEAMALRALFSYLQKQFGAN